MPAPFFHYSFLNNTLIGSEDPGVFGSSLKTATQFCMAFNIRYMISLTPEYENFCIEGLQRHHVPIEEMPSPSDMTKIFNIIEAGLSAHSSVWLHCQRGIDRTGCVIGSYLVSKGHDPEEVISELFLRFKKRINHPSLATLWHDKMEFIRTHAALGQEGGL